jgi:hypothetical protein
LEGINLLNSYAPNNLPDLFSRALHKDGEIVAKPVAKNAPFSRSLAEWSVESRNIKSLGTKQFPGDPKAWSIGDSNS